MTDDQRFASSRPDVMVYETAVLDEDLTLIGPFTASLRVSTTGTDSDVSHHPSRAPLSCFFTIVGRSLSSS